MKLVIKVKANKIFKFILKSVVWYAILCSFCSIAAVILCYFCIVTPGNVWLTFFKDIAVIIASTFAVSLLIGLLVEKNSKEDFYVDLIKDTISSKTFSQRLSSEEKAEVFKNINKNFRCNNNEALYNIYSDFEKRFVEQSFLESGYYFDECKYDISCKVEKEYIEKECTKTIYFNSYCDKKIVNELVLGGYSNKLVANKKSFELKSLTINGVTLSKHEVSKCVHEEIIKPDEESGPLLVTRNKYNSKTICKYTKKISLNSSKPFVISYNYITRTDISDNALTVRCSRPCKKFAVNFKIKNKDYDIKAIAFGFIDQAGDTPNTSDKQSVSVEFRNWILPEDGVVVLINKT